MSLSYSMGIAAWKLTDVNGREIMHGTEDPGRLGIGHLAPGIYLFHVVVEREPHSVRFIKE